MDYLAMATRRDFLKSAAVLPAVLYRHDWRNPETYDAFDNSVVDW